MDRFVWFAMACGCSYTPPPDPGVVAPDTPGLPADSTPADSMAILPDSPPDAVVQVPVSSDLVASTDTWIDSAAPNTPFGGTTTMLTDGGPASVSLLRFDLSGLPANTLIQSAELHVFTTDDPGDEVVVFPMLETWSEASATWNVRSTGVLWSTQGAAPPSRGETPIGSFVPNLAFTEFTAAIDTATVQGWVTTPASNAGIVLTSVNANGVFVRSRSAMNGKPFLRVVHVP